MSRVSVRNIFAVVVVVGCAASALRLAAQTTPVAQSAPAAQGSPKPASIADLTPLQQDDRLFKAPPVIEINADGTGAITVETMVAAPGIRAYIGTLNPHTRLDTPFFPTAVREDLKGASATAHRVPMSVRSLDGWLPPATDGSPREGEAYVRLEAYDPRTAAARYFETRMHYAVTNGRYERRTTVLLGPSVDLVTTSTAVISWNTDRPAFGRVELWTADGKTKVGDFSGAAGPSLTHVVSVTGLKAGTAYRYRALVTDQADGPVVCTGRFYTFRAEPPRATPFAFMFLSDGRPGTGGGFINFNGVNAEVAPRLIADGYRRGGAFALYGGDLTSGYTSSVEHFGMMLDTWKHVNDPVGHEMPIYEGFGNHESLHAFYRDASGSRYSTDRTGDVSSEGEFARRFVNPENGPDAEVINGVTGPSYKGTVYSFDYGNTHVVMLNTGYWFTIGGPAADRSLALKLLGGNRGGYIMKNQMAWLERDLAAARKRGVVHIFVAGHDPLLPVGGHVSDAMWWNGLNDASLPSGDVVAMRDRFVAILDRYRVTALLVGHEHLYARVVADKSVVPGLTRPIVQFVSGGAGAPFYAQDESVPWARAIKKFAASNHYVLFKVNGPVVEFEAIDLDGRVIDKGVLR
ncbi:MAG: metallophosphoesterase [Acidobacteria bacterium]|nr:metallophosphoesterase [Acidobacteriota bacterium]